jgi:Ca2+-binding EF-hand superfamily protein
MIIIKHGETVPEGYRNLTENEIAKDFVSLDNNNDYMISKNEWMINFIKMYEKDLSKLEQEGPASIMDKIQELSDEFDKIDTDNNMLIDFLEYKEFLEKNIFISD